MSHDRGPKTICPVCDKVAHLTSSRTIGKMWIPETGTRTRTVERRIECECAPRGQVYVTHRIELFRGESPVWTVNLPGRRRHMGKWQPPAKRLVGGRSGT